MIGVQRRNGYRSVRLRLNCRVCQCWYPAIQVHCHALVYTGSVQCHATVASETTACCMWRFTTQLLHAVRCATMH